MNGAAKFGSYLLGLAVVFGGALGAGKAVGPLDATRADEVERLVSDAAGRHGPIAGIANCVGSLLLKPAHLTSQAEFEQTLALSLGSAFGVVRAAGRVMAAQPAGGTSQSRPARSASAAPSAA